MDGDERERLKDQLEGEVTEWDLLFEIMVECKSIRHGFQTGNFGEYEREEPEQPTLYECEMCPKTVPEGEREEHLITQHGFPEGAGYEEEFSQA
jgi:hypothetical protein